MSKEKGGFITTEDDIKDFTVNLLEWGEKSTKFKGVDFIVMCKLATDKLVEIAGIVNLREENIEGDVQ